MTNEQVTAHCLKKPGAYEDFPFGEMPVCYKVCGRLFLQLYPLPGDHKITVSCEPMLADFYRRQFSSAEQLHSVVTAGYHCPDRLKPYMNTVFLNQSVSDAVIFEMIDHSYDRVVQKLTRSQRAELEKAEEANHET
jgi:predicted DNA-binding protein (MmcQ/YjbR family)